MPEKTKSDIFKAALIELMKVLQIGPSEIYELLNEMEEFQHDDDRPYSDDF